MHECWDSLGPETLGSIREAEGIPQDATTASVSLDGDHGAAETRSRTVAPRPPGARPPAARSSFHDAEGKCLKTLYPGRMPESGKLTLEGAACRSRHQASTPRDRDRRYRRWRRRQLDLPGDPVARNRGDRLLACLRTSANRIDHAVIARLVREVPRSSVTIPVAFAKVIRALRHLRDAAVWRRTGPRPSGELAFFRNKSTIACAYQTPEGIEGNAIGSGVVQAVQQDSWSSQRTEALRPCAGAIICGQAPSDLRS